MTLADLAARFRGPVKRDTRGLTVFCPVHADGQTQNRPSLRLTETAATGGLHVRCWAGCEEAAILAAVGLTLADLAPARRGNGTSGIRPAEQGILATYNYCHEDGTLAYQVVRLVPKDFRCRRPDGAGGYHWNMTGVERLLYRLPELRGARQVYIAEGEKDADALVALGLVATTNTGGAGKWTAADTAALLAAGVEEIIILPDNDPAGEAHAAKVAAMSHGAGLRVRIVRLPGLGPKGDVSDWLDAGHHREELEALAASAPEWDRAPSEAGRAEQPPRLTARPGVLASESLGRPVDPPLTDAGNAQRFAAEHGADVRYCYARNSWFVFVGPRWIRDDGDRVMAMTKATARTFLTLAAAASDDAERKRLARWGVYSQSEPGLRRMLALAQSEPGIPVAPHELDADSWLLNCPNGTVDLRTGTLRPHRREDLVTKMTAAPFDPAAQHPVWTAFLETALPDPGSRAYAQRWAGYCLTGDTREECFVFLLGPTGGGKTTFAEALRKAWGDYGMSADMSTFLHRRATDGPRDDVARLAEPRLVTATETRGNGSALAEGFLKLLSGGDTVAARRPYERTMEFTPRFKLLLAANDRPRASAEDAALWRRLRELPFPTSRPNREDRDDTIKRTLTDPAQAGAAILGWAVAGCLAWQREGLGDPPAVIQATAAYRRSMDRFGDFLGDRCLFEPAAWLPARDLRSAYETWAAEDGQARDTLLDGQRMGERLRQAGCRPIRKQGARAWEGLRLRTLTDDAEPESVEHPDAAAVKPW